VEIQYAGVVGLEERDFDAFVFEVALCLREIEGRVVRGGVPVDISSVTRVQQYREEQTSWSRR
jgi:hypothetical protein